VNTWFGFVARNGTPGEIDHCGRHDQVDANREGFGRESRLIDERP
jgi:hypothetical protein